MRPDAPTATAEERARAVAYYEREVRPLLVGKRRAPPEDPEAALARLSGMSPDEVRSKMAGVKDAR